MALFDCTCDAVSGHARALTYTTAHGDFHTPDVHARGHLRHGEGDHHRPAARARQPGGAREHLPLGHAPRRGAGGRGRGHPPLHELRRPHAHRLRRIPGVLACRHREARPTTGSRSSPSTTAARSTGRPRRTCASRKLIGADIAMQLDQCAPYPATREFVGARRGLLQRLGAPLPGSPQAARPDALRHRAGRHAPGFAFGKRAAAARDRGRSRWLRAGGASAATASAAIPWARITR